MDNPLFKKTTVLSLGAIAGVTGGMIALRRIQSASRAPFFHVQEGPQPGTALITGASSGIGAAFARRLAVERYNLILVGRREEKLTSLASQLQHQHRIQAEALVADLSISEGIEIVEQRIATCNDLSILVNNAGFGIPGLFAEVPLDDHLDMIHVHVISSVCLTRAALPGMLARRRGAIINVSSLAALLPHKGNVTYCATKNYLNAFSESLQSELTGSGVWVQALCPGLTRTEFHASAAYQESRIAALPSFLWMHPRKVVALSLQALEKGKTITIPGLRNVLILMLMKPQWVADWLWDVLLLKQKQ